MCRRRRIKHPHLGCSMVSELGESHFDLPHIVSIGGPTIGAGFLGAAIEPFVVQNPQQPPENTQPKVAQRPLPPPARPARADRGSRLRAHRRRRPRPRPPRPVHQTARMILSPHMRAFHLDEEPDAAPRRLRPDARSARAACWPAGSSRPASPSSRFAPTAGTPTSRTTKRSASSPPRSIRASPP